MKRAALLTLDFNWNKLTGGVLHWCKSYLDFNWSILTGGVFIGVTHVPRL